MECTETTFACFAKDIYDTVASGIPLLVALAVVLFFWGLVKFLSAGGSEQNMTQGKHLMMWGIVGIFVIVSVWGILRILTISLGISLLIPAFPTP